MSGMSGGFIPNYCEVSYGETVAEAKAQAIQGLMFCMGFEEGTEEDKKEYDAIVDELNVFGIAWPERLWEDGYIYLQVVECACDTPEIHSDSGNDPEAP